ncbi:MAG: hypothetical protein JWM64_67 [Frankiales bacterium]|nr:hypothetical protein [Frankiales bacterium]
MNPFLHLRTWLRTGPGVERSLTALVGALVLALVVWASLPSGAPSGEVLAQGSSSDEAATAAAETGVAPAAAVADVGGVAPEAGSDPAAEAEDSTPAPATGSAPAAVATVPATRATAGARPAGAAPRAAAPAAPGRTSAAAACGDLRATDQGVTDKTITVGVVVVDLGTLGNLIDLPSVADLKKAYGAVIDDVNAKGGVRCRKVVPRFYTDTGIDQSQQHAQCLQMQQDKVFAVFNNLFSPAEATCVAKARIPNIWYTAPHTPDVRQYAPYVLSWQPDYDQLVQHYVRGAKSQGWFTGMKKLGILERTCFPDEIKALTRELEGIGVDPGAASRFSFGCPAATPTPEQQQAAVLQFKREGVTHVLNVAYADDAAFSNAADQQAYDPAFAHMEDASATAIQTGSQKPGNSFDKTLLVSTIETGARTTPGYQYGAATKACTKVLQAAGLPAPYAEPASLYFGVACINLAMFKAAADAAPELTRPLLSTGLAKVGSMSLPYPAGPAVFSAPRRPTGGQLWRPVRWATSCQCWRVSDVHYRPGY